ncbi:DMT family transporter [Mesobacterium sp. TK19101]|uniref:DMT family transporter n=1 Tax=Mesobacterium hydrothermale TaxID=3111907 RepID=A0ABU6HF69_9RHOB|nr:DMT family transporter [Mesobacterium sp. TK19101]MEC3861082.1 DMT family transporter [Mesobacterium sp. TK19101]
MLLAAAGALVLTPDALLLRLSGMSGLQMVGWRGLCMGSLFVLAWLVTRKPGDMARLFTGAGLTIVLCQFFNAVSFASGIAAAPVSAVLMAVATGPVWSALLARAFFGERTSAATWITIAAVLTGIAIAVLQPDALTATGSLIGVSFGLGVAVALALNFVILRHNPDLPLLLAIGIGALLAGGFGWAMTGPERMFDGQLWAILITGLVILPTSFFAMSQASRMTAAANVSLLLLLETVLGPVWVWLGVGEVPGPRLVFGGAIVVTALALYLLYLRRRTR